MRGPALDRFMAKARKSDAGCWEWTGGKMKCGYGLFHLNGTKVVASRAAYTFFVGPIPDGKLICHTCDNRGCVNPDHLFVGSHQDNAKDMLRKGRAACQRPGYRSPKLGTRTTNYPVYKDGLGYFSVKCTTCGKETLQTPYHRAMGYKPACSKKCRYAYVSALRSRRAAERRK